MLTNYVTADDLYAAQNVERWIPRETADIKLRNAALYVSSDLRRRGVDPARLFPRVYIEESKTIASDYTSEAVEAYSSSRLVIEQSSEGYCEYSLQGKRDLYHDVINSATSQAIELKAAGEGHYSARFFEKYEDYKLVCETDESITFSAFLVDASADELIIWRAISDGMYDVLDGDDRTEALYLAAQKRYAEVIASFKADYSYSGDGEVDSELNESVKPRLTR